MRHDPDHALDCSGRDQSRRGDDGQKALAATRSDGGEDVAHADEFARRDGVDEPGDLGLVDTKSAVSERGSHAGYHAGSAARCESPWPGVR